jgi:hypothetical protein
MLPFKFRPAPFRPIAFLGAALALAVLSCGREPTAAVRNAKGEQLSQGIAFTPVFPAGYAELMAAQSAAPGNATAGLTQANQTSSSGVAFVSVRVVLRNADGSIAKDTLVTFPAGATEMPLTLTVPLPGNAPGTGVPLTLNLAYTNANGQVVFTGSAVVTAVPTVPGQQPPPPSPVDVQLTYVGPGSSATRVVISPTTLSVPMAGAFAFTAQAFDGNTVVPNTPIVFSVTNANIAGINSGTGAGQARLVRGSTTILASLLTGPSAGATLNVTPAPGSIVAVSGTGQSAKGNQTLPNPLVVRVNALDGLPMAGATVTFVTTGGTMSPTSATTDAAGLAQASWKLGPTVGAQSATASVAGAGSAAFSATALPPDPVKLVFTPAPPGSVGAGAAFGVTVQAQDESGALTPAFVGNVGLAVSGGPGALGGTSSLAAAGGIANFTNLAITAAGTYTLTATSGSLTPATATITVVPGAGASLSFTPLPSGGVAGSTLSGPIVTVRDASGNVVTSFSGSISLTAAGPAGGGFVGSPTATATVTNGVATFTGLRINVAGTYAITASATGVASGASSSITITPGPAATLTLVSGGGQSAAGGAALSAGIVVKVADAFGNGVSGTNVTFAPAAGSGSVNPTSILSGGGGLAATAWTVGAAAGTHTLSVSAAGVPTPLIVSATATGAAGPGPATQLIFSTNPVSANAGVAISPSIVVTAKDALGAIATSFGGSVTLAIGTNPSGGSLSGTVTVAAVSGVATFAGISINNVGVGYTLTASSSPLSPATSTAFNITSPAATVTWSGATSTAWSTATNWSPATVPTSTDVVFIPSTANSPVLSASVIIAGLTLAPGASLSIGSNNLIISGNLDAGTTITGTGLVSLTGTGTYKGVIAAPLAVSGTYTLNGRGQVTSPSGTVISGSLDAGGFTFETTDLTVSGAAGVLRMVTATDSVIVNGNATFNGMATPAFPPSSTVLTNGVLRLKGNFSQLATVSNQSFVATTPHKTVLDGVAGQTISFATPGSPGSWMSSLEIRNAAGIVLPNGGIAFGTVSVIAGAGSVTGTAFTVGFGLSDPTDKWRVTTTTFANNTAVAIPPILTGNAVFSGTINQSIATSATVTGNVTVTGQFGPGANTLTVGGTFATSGTGTLKMTTVGGVLNVSGNATFGGGSEAGLLTLGQINLAGDFLQNGNAAAFQASATHITRFTGATPSIVFTNAGSSGFGALQLHTTGAIAFGSGIVAAGDVWLKTGAVPGVTGVGAVIGGGLYDTTGGRWQVSSTTMSTGILPKSLTTNLVFSSATANLADSVTVTGTVTVQGATGQLNVNGKKMTVTGSFTTSTGGTLQMTNAGDSLLVKGTATFGGGNQTGLLTNGYLAIGGDFSQNTTATAFKATSPHETWFVDFPAGPLSHTVTFANPSFANSHFGTVYFADTLTVFGGDVFADGKFETGVVANHHIKSTTGDHLLISKGADIRGVLFDNVRWQLLDGYTVDDMDVVTFTNISANTLTQFDVQRTGAFAMDNLTNWNFQTSPVAPGLFIKATDTDGATSGFLTVNFIGVLPTLHNGFASALGGAIITGWANTATWTGVTDVNWLTAGNWSSFAVPTASTDVVIPSGTPNAPSITAGATSMKDLTINAGAVLSVNQGGAATVVVSGNLVVGAGAKLDLLSVNSNVHAYGNITTDTAGTTGVTSCTGGATIITQVAATHNVQGKFCKLNVTGNSAIAVGPVVIPTGGLLITTGNFTVGGQVVRVGSLTTQTSGTVTMTNANDSLIVTGAAAFNGGATTGLLTAGNLVVGGNLTVSTNALALDASGSHTTTFNGAGVQSIGWSIAASANKGFKNIQVMNAGSKQFSSDLYITGDMTCDVSLNTGAVSGSFQIYIGGNLVDNSPLGTGCWSGSTMLNFTGTPVGLPAKLGVNTVTFKGGGTVSLTNNLNTNNIIVDGAGTRFKLNGRTVTTNANNFTTQNSATLEMTNAADSLVTGAAIFNGGSTTGLLTQGALVTASFTQGVTASAFSPDSTHRTRLQSGVGGPIVFANPGFGAGLSHFGTLIHDMGSTSTLNSDIFVEGQLKSGSGVQFPFTAATTRLITARGAAIATMWFTNVRLLLLDGQPVTQLDNIRFKTMTGAGLTTTQFEIQRTGTGASGSIPASMANPLFDTPPTTGLYIKTTGTASLILTPTGTYTPAAMPTGFVSALGGSVINWPSVVTAIATGNWSVGGTWSGGVVPDSFSNVSIPAGRVVTLTSSLSFAKNITITSTGQIVQGAFDLTAYGNVDADTLSGANRAFTCSTGILYQPDQVTGSVKGHLCRYHSGGAITQSGPIVADSVFHIHDGTFTMGGNSLRTKEAWIGFGTSLSGTGALVMSNAIDSLIVSDSLLVGKLNTAASAGVSTITNGFLSVAGKVFIGGVAGSGFFNAAAAHRTELTGAAKLLKVSDTTASGFGKLRINGSRIVGANSIVRVADTLNIIGGSSVADTSGQTARWKVAGNLVAGTGSSITGRAFELGGTYGDSGTFSPDTTVFTGGAQTVPDTIGVASPAGPAFKSIRVKGNATFVANSANTFWFINGDFIVDGGQARIGNGLGTVFMQVNNALTTKNAGTLKMVDANSTIAVIGTASFQGGSTTGLLTAGELQIASVLTQGAGSTSAFAPSGSFNTRLVGSGAQTITFSNPTLSFFQNLLLAQTSPGGAITLGSDVVVNGTLSRVTALAATLSGGATRLITVAGLSQTGTSLTFNNVGLRLVDGLSVTFNNATFQGFGATYAGTMFDVARTSGSMTLTSLTFSGTLSDGVGRYLNSSTGAAVTLVTPTPNSTGATAACACTGTNYKAGAVTWP